MLRNILSRVTGGGRTAGAGRRSTGGGMGTGGMGSGGAGGRSSDAAIGRGVRQLVSRFGGRR